MRRQQSPTQAKRQQARLELLGLSKPPEVSFDLHAQRDAWQGRRLKLVLAEASLSIWSWTTARTAVAS